MPYMLIIYGSNTATYRVGPFGSALDMHSFGRSGSIRIFQLLDARTESELSLRLHGKTIEFDNAGYIIPVRYKHCDS